MRRRFATLIALLPCACSSSEPGPSPTALVPLVPSGVAVTHDNGTLVVTWTDGSDDEDEFVIGRVAFDQAGAVVTAEALEIVGAVGPNTTRFVDDAVLPALRYGYGVSARKDSVGRSDFVVQSGEPVLVPIPVEVGACGGEPTTGDRDGDGLSDDAEEAGWSVRVDETGRGTFRVRTVPSDPRRPDTDGDGLCDREENTLRTDPRRSDTDGDGLADRDEVERWGSSPTNVDGDGDAQGNSLFFDGGEVLTFGTSPTLADTDGDGRSDFVEINQDGTHALIADLPVPSLELVGDIDLGLNIRLSNGTEEANAESHTFESAQSRSTERTSGTATQRSIETSETVSVEASVGYPFSGGGSVSGSLSETAGYVQSTSTDFAAGSTEEAQQAYERATTRVVSANEEIIDATLAVNLEIANRGTRTFEIGNVVLTALRRDRGDPTSFTSIATLEMPADANQLVIGEGDLRGPFRVEANVPANVALDLLANPSGLVFHTSGFSLTDRTGEDFEFRIGEQTNNRTALITIDFGGLRPVERYRVATNVERTADGRPAGVLLADVLERVIGIPEGIGYATLPNADGVQVPVRIRDVEAVPNANGGSERFWLFFAGENDTANVAPVSERLLDPALDFGAKRLMPRDTVFLAYVSDRDGDRLIAREERLYGTSDDNPDSDGDGLTDHEETREGWDVNADLSLYIANRRVFSNPTSADADRDGWDDPTERQNGTDPNRRDTDGDGLLDPVDPEPLLGPTESWIRAYGTDQVEQVHFVAASGSRILVLGHSAGDIDGDGTSGGPFLMGVDAADGAAVWTHQLEGVTDYPRSFVVNAAGHVLFMAELAANVLPGGNPATQHMMVWDVDGDLVRSVNLVDVPYVGAFASDRVAALVMMPTTDGGAAAFFDEIFLSGDPALRTAVFDADGNWASGRSFGTTGTPAMRAASAAGLLIAASFYTSPTSCHVQLFRDGSDFAGNIPFCVVQRAGAPGQIALDLENALHIAVRDGSGADTVRRYGLDGTQVGMRTFPGFARPQVTSLVVDATNQLYTAVRDAASPRSVRIDARDASGALLWRAELGDASTSIVGSVRDRVGNLFSAGVTTGGFAGEITGRGGADAILIRNPQIRYEVQ